MRLLMVRLAHLRYDDLLPGWMVIGTSVVERDHRRKAAAQTVSLPHLRLSA